GSRSNSRAFRMTRSIDAPWQSLARLFRDKSRTLAGIDLCERPRGFVLRQLLLKNKGFQELHAMSEPLDEQNDRPLAGTGEGFRLLVESVLDYAIFMLDPRGYVLTWNAGAERIKGYK